MRPPLSFKDCYSRYAKRSSSESSSPSPWSGNGILSTDLPHSNLQQKCHQAVGGGGGGGARCLHPQHFGHHENAHLEGVLQM